MFLQKIIIVCTWFSRIDALIFLRINTKFMERKTSKWKCLKKTSIILMNLAYFWNKKICSMYTFATPTAFLHFSFTEKRIFALQFIRCGSTYTRYAMLELKQPKIVKLVKKKIKIFGKRNFRYCKIYKLIHISLRIGNTFK